jgi:hypothetical protein
MADKLPPTLTLSQLQGASKDLAGQGAPREVVQGFVDNYKPDGKGNFVLKTAQPVDTTPTPESQGAIKQADGTYRAPTFLEGLKQVAIGAGNFVGSQAVGLGKWAVNAVKPSSNTILPQNRDPQKNAIKDVPYNQAIQLGTDLQNQMAPQNQAQQGGATAANVAEIALPLAKPVAGVIENAPRILKGGVEVISKLIAGKTEQEILATAPEDVFKLPKAQRDIWFNNKSSILEDSGTSKIDKLTANAELDKANVEVNKQLNIDKINKDLQIKNNITDKQASDLQKELSQKGNKSASDLRTAANQLNKDKSTLMGQMKAQAIVGKEDIVVKKIQLSSTIDGMTKDPNVAAVVKNQLGIQGTGRGGQITLGEISDKLTSLRAMNNYNPSDYATNEAVKVLENILKNNGVDNSAANTMWSTWSDTKNAIDNSFDIFNKSGLTTDTASAKLIKAATGDEAGAGNANFIKTIEKMTGENFTSDIKETLSKLDVNQKQALANSDWAKQAIKDEIANAKINTEAITSGTKTGVANANTEIKAGKTALSSQQIEVGRQARLRDTIKWTIKGVAAGLTGVELDKFVKKYTGIGF